MKFFGRKKVIEVDENYSQIAKLGKFWNEMRETFPEESLYGLGANMNGKTIDYYIGKIDLDWQEGLESIELPDDGWVEFSCEETDESIQQMYREIYQQATPEYEIESMSDGIFTTRVHFIKNGEMQ